MVDVLALVDVTFIVSLGISGKGIVTYMTGQFFYLFFDICTISPLPSSTGADAVRAASTSNKSNTLMMKLFLRSLHGNLLFQTENATAPEFF